MTLESAHHHTIELDDSLDFINTIEHSAAGDTDELDTPERAIAWLAARDLLHRPELERVRAATTADPTAGARLLDRVQRYRSGLRETFDAVTLRRPPDPAALADVNRVLAAREIPQLVATPDGIEVGHRHVGDPIDDALTRVGEPLLREIAAGGASRFRICANDDCRWVFADRSPAGRRRWCSMASCGNRAKAARHRARQRGTGEPAEAEA